MPKLLAALVAAILAIATVPTAAADGDLAISAVSIATAVAPPPLPVYDQPPLPAAGFVWAPGYWAWDAGAADYYWVPGTWVEPPRPGLLWTPAYWESRDGIYAFHEGYWAPDCGFYGGVPYGFGYSGPACDGGYWDSGVFLYNREATNIGEVAGVRGYSKSLAFIETPPNSFSYSGPGGIAAFASTQQVVAARQPHVPATAQQQQHQQAAHARLAQFAEHNHGYPPIGSTARAGILEGPGTAPAKIVTVQPVDGAGPDSRLFPHRSIRISPAGLQKPLGETMPRDPRQPKGPARASPPSIQTARPLGAPNRAVPQSPASQRRQQTRSCGLPGQQACPR